MNSFLTAMAFAIAVGSSPVMAQSRDTDADPGNIAPAERRRSDTGTAEGALKQRP
jgi:hypothetical protein